MTDVAPGKQLLQRHGSTLAARTGFEGAEAPPLPVPGKATGVAPLPFGAPRAPAAERAGRPPYRFENGVAIVSTAWLRGTAAPDAGHVLPARVLEVLVAARDAGATSISDEELGAAARDASPVIADGADVARIVLPGARDGAWAADVTELAPRLGLGAVDVRSDGAARAITDGKAARGVALGNVVYLHPDRVKPGTRAGREVLAHELVHLAQARLPTGDGVEDRDAAEHEAAELAPRVAAGATAMPRHAIDLSRPAADGDVLPDPSTRYGFSLNFLEKKIAKNLTLSGALQAYVKDQDGTHTVLDKGGDGDIRASLLAQEAYIRNEGEKLVGQIATSVAKIENLWDLDSLSPLPGLVDLTFKVETKLFDAAFSADQVSLDLARITFAFEADVTKLILGGHLRGRRLDALVKSSTIKLALRLAVRLPADVIANLYRLHQAKRDLLIAREADIQRRAAKRALRKAEKKLAKAGLMGARSHEAMKRVLLARKRFARANAVWKKARELAIRAAKTMKTVGAALAKTAAGRAASRMATGAMKLIPGLNLVMAGKDIFEAGVLLYKLLAGNAELAFGGGDGGGAEEGSDEESEGSEEIDVEPGDSAGGDGEGADGDSGDDAEGVAATGAGDGERAADGDSATGSPDGKGGTVIDGELTEADVDPPEHHAVAKQVLGGLEVDKGDSGAGLAPEDEAVLAGVIPADLTAAEIAELLAHVKSSGTGEAADMVTAIVAALEEVRPGGQKRPPAVQAAPQETAPAPSRRRQRTRAAGAADGREAIDPLINLRANSSLVAGPRIVVPPTLDYQSMRLSVKVLKAASPDYQTATVWVTLTITDVLTDNVYIVTPKGAEVKAAVGDEYMYRYEAAALTEPDEHTGAR